MEADGEIVLRFPLIKHMKAIVILLGLWSCHLCLSRDIDFKGSILPVCLPWFKRTWWTFSDYCFLVRMPHRGGRAQYNLQDNSHYNDKWSLQVILKENGYTPSELDRMLCGAAPGVSGCQGDSGGGPWVTRDGNNNYVDWLESCPRWHP